jgi:hypothetical protein
VEHKKSNPSPEDMFTKFYIKAVLTHKTPVVSQVDLLNAIAPYERQIANDFFGSRAYRRWVVFARGTNDLIALPSLAEQLRKQKVEKMVAWLYYTNAKNLVHKFVGDVTLTCNKRNGYFEELLIYANELLEVQKDWSEFDLYRNAGKVVYRIYDTVWGNKVLYGSIVEVVEVCASCYYDEVFNYDLKDREPRSTRCVTYDFA